MRGADTIATEAVASVQPPWLHAALGASAVAIALAWAIMQRRPAAAAKRKDPSAANLNQPGPRAERRLAKKMEAEDKVRECVFCKVVVPLDQTAAHLGGKRHRKLAADPVVAADCWRWVPASKHRGANDGTQPMPPPAATGDAPGVASDVAPADAGGRWSVARRKHDTASSSARHSRPPAASFDTLPTLGFKVLAGGVEPILPLIRSGAKQVDLRRKGSRLSDGTVIDHLSVGHRFVGVPLANALRYRCVLAVDGPIEHFASHGAAWEMHRQRALPASLGKIKSAQEAQRFIEFTFYDGRTIDEPVIAIPVRVIAWLEGQ